MRRMGLCSIVVTLVLLMIAPVAHAQLRLVGQNFALTDFTVTPLDPSAGGINVDSSEILAVDVPPIPSAAYVQFTSSAVWLVEFAGLQMPERANFQLRFNVTSTALPPGISLHYVVPLTNYFNNVTTAAGFLGGTGTDSEVLTRNYIAQFLLAENPSLTSESAKQVANDLFRQGFHVSVFARLAKCRNVTDAIVTNPNVAFFAQPGGVQ